MLVLRPLILIPPQLSSLGQFLNDGLTCIGSLTHTSLACKLHCRSGGGGGERLHFAIKWNLCIQIHGIIRPLQLNIASRA